MNKMGAGKMYRVNKNGQSSNNYGGGHTGKGKKGKSKKRDSKSVYAVGNHSVLFHHPKPGCGYNGPRRTQSCVMNPVWFGLV